MVRNKLQWDVNNAARLSFVLKILLRRLRPSIIYSEPCDRILQRTYLRLSTDFC